LWRGDEEQGYNADSFSCQHRTKPFSSNASAMNMLSVTIFAVCEFVLLLPVGQQNATIPTMLFLK